MAAASPEGDTLVADETMENAAETVPAASTRWVWAGVAGLLILHAGLAVDALRRHAVTVDEVAHLPAGITYWQQGTFELYHHNPPLVKLLAALPALATRPVVDYSQSWSHRAKGMPLSPWAFGWEFMYANAAQYHDIYFWARLTIVALSLAAGVVIFRWARELFGAAAGLLALGLWATCPNAIAFAGLITSDVGATSLGFIATYVFWRFLRRPGWWLAAAAGVLLGLAILSKFSVLLLYGLWPLLWLIRQRLWGVAAEPNAKGKHLPNGVGRERIPTANVRVRAGGGVAAGCRQFARGLGLLAGSCAVSLLVVNLGYKCEGSFERLGDYVLVSRSLTRPRHAAGPPPGVPATHPLYRYLATRENRFRGTWLGALPVPLPRHFVLGFDEQKLESEGGYPVYLCGELRRTGWWWYYFFALLVKVPLSVWVMTGLAVYSTVRRGGPRLAWRDELVFLLPAAAILLGMSFLTDINLGLRYVLPIFPFWFVWISRVAGSAWPWRWQWGVVAVALLWNGVVLARIHPHPLAYFNELVGGPTRGHHYLIDSNLDWGQDLLELSAWLRAHRPGRRVGLAYFGNVDPSVLAASGQGIDFRLAPPRDLDDLELLSATGDARLQALMRDWLAAHESAASQWSREHPGTALWHMPEFQSAVANALEVGEGPQPGLYAISANLLHGLPFRIRDHRGNLWDFANRPDGRSADPYGYFRRLRPIARIGYSIFVYEISHGAKEGSGVQDSELR
jgi:4-amino-4-deoxy-L-arabinose transferase-like glycosyltransferase